MMLFAALASVVFGAMAKDTNGERWLYGLKVFAGDWSRAWLDPLFHSVILTDGCI
jgi:hypothetical protein